MEEIEIHHLQLTIYCTLLCARVICLHTILIVLNLWFTFEYLMKSHYKQNSDYVIFSVFSVLNCFVCSFLHMYGCVFVFVFVYVCARFCLHYTISCITYVLERFCTENNIIIVILYIESKFQYEANMRCGHTHICWNMLMSNGDFFCSFSLCSFELYHNKRLNNRKFAITYAK